MLHFALVQKEQESLAETEPLPQQRGQQGGRGLAGAAHHICQLPGTDHMYCRVPLHLTLDTGHGSYLHRVKWIHLGSDNQEKSL